MSRVGKKPIEIPSGINVEINKSEVIVESSGKKMSHKIPEGIKVIKRDNQIIVERNSESRFMRGMHGLTRSLINNMIIGFHKGFKKRLQIVGRGKRAKVQGKKIVLDLGFSHSINYKLPDEIDASVEKNIIEITGFNKQQVGEIAAEIRDIQPPEPYKGAGIRYEGERIRKKAGKSAIGGGFTGGGK